MTVAVADTTLLSYFAHVRRPDLPILAFPERVVPGAVLEELREGERRGLVPVCDWSPIPVVEPTQEEVSAIEHLRDSLDRGELAAIAVALRRGAVLVTDDRAARQNAGMLGLHVSGTLGVPSADRSREAPLRGTGAQPCKRFPWR